jgi:hypothetical protein
MPLHHFLDEVQAQASAGRPRPQTVKRFKYPLALLFRYTRAIVFNFDN